MESSTSQQSKLQLFKRYLETKALKSIYPSPTSETIKTKSQKPIKPRLQTIKRIDLDAHPIDEKTLENVLSKVDGRIQVTKTEEWPYSVHGVVSMTYNGYTAWGTGTLIGPNIVLTAGHNLYNHEQRCVPDRKSIQFLPAINGQVLPFGAVEVEQYFISPEYVKEDNQDFGLLVLKEPIGHVTGYFGLACLEENELKTKKINITGYPGDKVASKPKTYEMWGMEGKASSISQKDAALHYVIDTGAGQSGSGVWYQEGEDYYVCGVHIQGGRTANKATLLTKENYERIYKWIRQANVSDYVVSLKDHKKLEFKDHQVDLECLKLLMKYNLDGLRVLDLGGKEIGSQGVMLLAKNTSWTELSELNLNNNNIDLEGVKALVKNTAWGKLEKLSLNVNKIGAEGAEIFAKNSSWTALTELHLNMNNIGGEGIKALVKNTSWVNLTKLSLNGNKIGPEGAKALAENAPWKNLDTLNLLLNQIGAEGAKALAKNTSWGNLKRLDLYKNNIGAEGAKYLAGNVSWVNLEELNLSNNNIGIEGAKSLAENVSWVRLGKLELNSNGFGNEGARELAKNVSWGNLVELDLTSNNITTEGIVVLARNKSWTKLPETGLHV